MTRRPQRVHYVCGASGVGTSTRAAELHRACLDEPDRRGCCTIATDVVRAQLRAVLGDVEAQPDLWGESFDLAAREGDTLRDGVATDAFLRQCEPILRAVEAGVAYALTEGWDVVVEGVHLVPGAFATPPVADGVEVTVELIVIDDPIEHARRFRARDASSGGRRPAAHYERNLSRIRTIQALLVERWEAWDAPAGVQRLPGREPLD